MNPTNWYVDYDQIAATYDKRYDRNQYAEVENTLLQFVAGQERLQILEAGCGTGHWLKLLHNRGHHAVGLDLSAQMLRQARSLLPDAALIRGRAEHLPFPAETFDCVFCINAIHHFVDKPVFLKEARHILRPGGKMLNVGLNPHTGIDQWYIYDYFPNSIEIDRQRYPPSSSLEEWMREAGFEACTTHEVEHWIIRLPAREILKQGRLDRTATSQLSVLTDKQYRRGLQRIYAEIEGIEEKGKSLFLTTDLRLYATTGSVPGQVG
jgi:ubiquinone/menaquinone biosynthesis C-methylase UbiE